VEGEEQEEVTFVRCDITSEARNPGASLCIVGRAVFLKLLIFTSGASADVRQRLFPESFNMQRFYILELKIV
jgi:hypothetical protein